MSRVGDLVEVTSAETVVRLDGRPGRLEELVLTGDVHRSLHLVLEAAAGERGAGFLLVGHFGSGKSHFLAAVGELLEDPTQAPVLASWDPALRGAAASARPSLVVTVPLVEYRADAELEEVTWRRAWAAAGGTPPPLATDRAAGWAQLLATVRASGRSGLLLLVDELSEFLRAKRGPGLTEDLRFLQWLGEWAREQPVVVLGALQESLDEVANVSERELARIRDRYPVRLGLSMRHVEDLVRGRLVRLRPGAEAEIQRVYQRLSSAFPGWPVSAERFDACYPVHPQTLVLLDGLRFVLSQQRGVVDFICRQLRGDPAAGISPWLDEDADRLLTPDRVYDHFAARLRERVETSRLAETVVPYYERAVTTLFESPPDQDLALRAVKLLTLLAASPLERRRDAGALAAMLLTRVSALDPEANVSYLQRVILQPLAEHGAYVVAARGPDGVTTYEVAQEADASITAARLLEQVRAEVEPTDRRVVDALAEHGGTTALSLPLLRQAGRSRRQVIWQQTLRQLLVTTARVPELKPHDVEDLLAAAERVGAEALIVVAEPETAGSDPVARARQLAAAAPQLAFWVPDPLKPDELAFATELLSREIVLRRVLDEETRDAGGLIEFLRRSLESDVARAREVLRRCYFQGRLVGSAAQADLDLPPLSGQPFDVVLRAIAAPLLDALHPDHQQVQPHAELVGDRHLRRLVSLALAGPRLTVAAADREGVRGLVEAYLLPLGLVRRRGDAYHVTPDPARSVAVAALLRLVRQGPVPTGELVRTLAAGRVGLTEPESLLLLNAAVESGIVHATRGRQTVEAPFPSLAEVDRVGPGELVAPELRGLVLELGGVFGPGPHEPWDARVQQTSWEYARTWLEGLREDTAQVTEGMRRLSGSALYGDLLRGTLPEDVERAHRLLDAVDRAAGPREGLQALLSAVEQPDELLRTAGHIAAAARFCRADLERYLSGVGYLMDPELRLPESPAYEGLRTDRGEALTLAANVLVLAADDAAGGVLDALEQFRRAFIATYAREHADYFRAAGPEAAAGVRSSGAYRALSRLAEVAPVAVPDDRARVDRMLAAATVPACHRNVEAELAFRPLCGCGFRLGAEAPSLEAEAVVAVAARGVAEHLAQLDQVASRARLEKAATDLESLGQTELASDLRHLLTVASRPEGVEAAAVDDLLKGPVFGVLQQVLRGAQLVTHRDLSALREELAGRRYTKRRLLELLRTWVEGPEGLGEQAVVEVDDSAEAAAGGSAPDPAASTVEALRARFPEIAARLPADRPADAFWLAAWWARRPDPPAWLPPRLLESPESLARAATPLLGEPGPREELAALDRRVREGTLLGDQVAAALGLGGRRADEVAAILLEERMLRHPVRLAAQDLVDRLGADLLLTERLPGDLTARLEARHALLSEADLAPLGAVLAAAGHLAALQRDLTGTSPVRLVEELYPAQAAPVPALLSEAAAGWALLGGAAGEPTAGALAALERTADRLLGDADRRFAEAARAGYPDCLQLWQVGEAVVAPLLRRHGRVAVLLVDAMRADLWARLRNPLAEVLPRRRLRERWAVVPTPTRTAESVTAMALGRPIAAGDVAAGDPLPPPFAHLGYQAQVLLGADRDHHTPSLLELWRAGPPLSIAVATGVDERLHHSPVELAALLTEASAALQRRVLPTLQALPPEVPLVVLADHGFRENRSWGRGSPDRYAHGGPSLQESVVPVAILET